MNELRELAESSESAKPFEYWLSKNWYYHGLLKSFYRFVIPKGMRVLHVGSKSGYLLKAVEPSVGVGVDDDETAIARIRNHYPEFQFFVGRVDSVRADLPFDYIILSSFTMEVEDIQTFLQSLHHFCHPGTRIVIDAYSYVWEPVLWITQQLGLRRPTSLKNWLSQADLINVLQLSDFEVVTKGGRILMPMYIPGISWFCNTIAIIPGINRACLSKWIIARPQPKINDAQDYVVSVIIPCRNERGNIEAAIQRCPKMGKRMEIIFVEGHSKDDTLQEAKRVQSLYKDCDITVLVQDGKGKADAVRKGFAYAKGDILMILDADLTMTPEELPKFFDALVQGKGEFINGSRLVYGMESQAMRFLNLLANYCFGVLFSWILGQRVKDTLCGTKVLFKRDYERIVQGRRYFGDFDPFGDFDLLFGAAKLNLKIVDMPVHYKNRTYGTTQISRWKHGWLLLQMSLFGIKRFKGN